MCVNPLRKMNLEILNPIIEGLYLALHHTNRTLITYDIQPSQIYACRPPRGEICESKEDNAFPTGRLPENLKSVAGPANAAPDAPAVFGGGGDLHVRFSLEKAEVHPQAPRETYDHGACARNQRKDWRL